MNIRLYQFSKRPNSTKRPDNATATSFTCQLKDATSFMAPVLRFAPDTLTPGSTFTPNIFNYAYIPYWSRYYYITDWKYINGVWECYLTPDVLASFKTEIGATSAYIIRSASQYNGDILDSFYPATTVTSITKQQLSSDIYHTTIPGGCFVVGVVNKSTSSNKMGAVIYYALTASQFGNLLSYLFSDNIYTQAGITASEITSGLYKSLVDPFQYIVSCMWFPFSVSALGDSTEVITVGYWSTNVTGTIVKYVTKEIGFKSNTAIAHHPQISRGAYLDHEPYTRITAFYPPFGEIPIDTSFLQYGNNNYLYGKMFCDFVTGLADCYITITNGYDTDTTADPYKYMTMRTSQIGVPIQISQVLTDYMSMLNSGASALSSLASFNIAGLFGNIVSGIQNSMPKVSSLGANGSLIEIITPPYLIIEHKQMVDENLAEFGRPLCNTRVISTLSGFVQCGEDDHSFTGTLTENNEINKHLKEGFFYE